MAGCSKVTGTLRQEILQMRAKEKTLSAIAREVGLQFLKYGSFYNDTKSLKKSD